MTTARAAILTGPGKVSIARLEFDAPGRGEVLLRLVASGICHTDLHIARSPDGWGFGYPQLLGHEGAGIVEEVGEDVTNVSVGNRVVVGCRVACGDCSMCRKGQSRRCRLSSARRPSLRLADGTPVVASLGIGLFADRILVDARALVPVGPDIPLERVGLFGCAVMTGVGAVLNTARVWPGASVAVVGCGGIGLSVVQGARLANATRIVAVDVLPQNLTWARRMGATDTVDAGEGDPVERVRGLTGGEGVDFSFEAVGLPACVDQCIRMLAYGGTATLIGVPQPGAVVAVDLADRSTGFFPNTVTLTVTHGGEGLPPQDFPVFERLYRQGNSISMPW